MLHVHRHRPHAGDLAPEPRGSGRRQPLYQHQVLRCVDGGRRDSEVVPELEDATDGPGGMGQHPTPPRPKNTFGTGILSIFFYMHDKNVNQQCKKTRVNTLKPPTDFSIKMTS